MDNKEQSMIVMFLVTGDKRRNFVQMFKVPE